MLNVPHIPNMNKAKEVSFFYASSLQANGIPIKNLLMKDINDEVKETFRKGEIIELSYETAKNEDDNLTSILPNSGGISIENEFRYIELLPFIGDNSLASWIDNSKISSYNLLEELTETDCDNSNNFNCDVKSFLESNKNKSQTIYNVTRKFMIPDTIPVGEYYISIPMEYMVYKKINDTDYESEIKFYHYKKRIKIVE